MPIFLYGVIFLQVWSRDRIAAGWSWGSKRDDRKKLHPSLLAYGKLSDDDKQWDRDSARQTLAVIRALGYDIKLKKSVRAARRTSVIAQQSTLVDSSPPRAVRNLSPKNAPEITAAVRASSSF